MLDQELSCSSKPVMEGGYDHMKLSQVEKLKCGEYE